MSRNEGVDQVVADVRQAEEHLLRYATECTPDTGITTVNNQERQTFRHSLVLAPWCPLMPSAQAAFAKGQVVDTGWSAVIPLNGSSPVVKVFRTTSTQAAPVLYLGVDGHFQGRASPYDTPALADDALLFGLAVHTVLTKAGAHAKQFVWGADWQSVPALLLLRARHHVALTLHNTYDKWLATQPHTFSRPEYGVFQASTALQAGLEAADVATCVNRGYAWGLRHEIIHRQVIAAHLQRWMSRIIGVDNASFDPPSRQLCDLAGLLSRDLKAGVNALYRLKDQALRQLPDEVRQKARGKVIVVSMGRRVAQKLPDLLVESLRHLLQKPRAWPLLAIFATTHGDDSSEGRLDRIKQLATDFPEHVVWTDGRLPYYQDLMNACDFNCMCSLYEPHGGAFAGTAVPLARAIDGLAAQICAYQPTGAVARLNALWHAPDAMPSGLLFREEATDPEQTVRDLTELLEARPAPANPTFSRLQEALSASLEHAVDLRLHHPEVYARLVLGALQQQLAQSWERNLGGMLALIEAARLTREIAG